MKEMPIKEQIKRRGYRSAINPYFPSNEFIKTSTHLTTIPLYHHSCEVNLMLLKDAINDTEQFYTSFYKIHPVQYLKYYLNLPFLKIMKMKRIDPFSLPIIPKKIIDEVFYGALIADLPASSPISFLGIELNSIVTEVSSCSYAHEITHAEVDSVPKSLSSYYNSEVLSIFIELQMAKLLSSDEKILRIEDKRRLYEIVTLTNELAAYHQKLQSKSIDDALIDSKYLISDIRAYNLFSEYYYGSNSTKEYIQSRIQSIFDGNYTVEELLNEFMDIDKVNDLNPKLTLSNQALKYFQR